MSKGNQCKCEGCRLEMRFRQALVEAWASFNDQGLEPYRILRTTAQFAGGAMAIAQDTEEYSEGEVRAQHYSNLEEGYAQALANLDMPRSRIASAKPQGNA